MMYIKLNNNYVKIDTWNKLIPNKRAFRNSHEKAFRIPSYKTTARKESFYPKPTREWNTLPNCKVSAPSPESLKAKLRQ